MDAVKFQRSKKLHFQPTKFLNWMDGGGGRECESTWFQTHTCWKCNFEVLFSNFVIHRQQFEVLRKVLRLLLPKKISFWGSRLNFCVVSPKFNKVVGKTHMWGRQSLCFKCQNLKEGLSAKTEFQWIKFSNMFGRSTKKEYKIGFFCQKMFTFCGYF